MEKNQYSLCLEVLKRLDNAGILNDIILVGSWCVYFYEEYFKGIDYTSAIRTRDLDFLVPIPTKFKRQVDIPEMLKDLGFIIQFSGMRGWIKLSHPELIIEFLVPERGRGSDKPYPLPQLKVNAQPLRFLDFLADNSIKIRMKDFSLQVPHPAAFALHKLIISKRRTKQDKKDRDTVQALNILNALIEKGEEVSIKSTFKSMIPKWQKKVLQVLQNIEASEILKLLV